MISFFTFTSLLYGCDADLLCEVGTSYFYKWLAIFPLIENFILYLIGLKDHLYHRLECYVHFCLFLDFLMFSLNLFFLSSFCCPMAISINVIYCNILFSCILYCLSVNYLLLISREIYF